MRLSWHIFFEDEDEQEELTLKAKQKKEQEQLAQSKKHLQSSAQNTKLGEYECLSLPTLLQMMKATLAEMQDTIECDINEAAILMRAFGWKKERSEAACTG